MGISIAADNMRDRATSRAQSAKTWIAQPKAWRFSYVLFTLGVLTLSASRSLWAQPNAAWQTNLNYLPAIDRFLSGDIISQLWVETGGQHATSAYRYFEYVNAALFGFTTHTETIVYFATMGSLTIAFGLRALRTIERTGDSVLAKTATFAIPLVLLSMLAAGSRGMELGQYTGIALFIALVCAIDSGNGRRITFAFAVISGPLLTFWFLGMYAIAPTLTLIALAILQRGRQTLGPGRARFLYTSIASFVSSLIAWIALYFVNPIASTPTTQNSLASAISKDFLFPVKYLLSGLGSSLINVHTLELSGRSSRYVLVVGAVVSLILILGAFLAVARVPHASTVPIALITYGLTLIPVLMVGRTSSAYFLLNEWYGFHFRLMVAGGIWALAIGASKSKIGNPIRRFAGFGFIAAILILMLALVVDANAWQWKRQPYERAYFQTLQAVSLFPTQLVETGGVTQLQTSKATALAAIEILRSRNLGVYADPVGAIRSMTGNHDPVALLGEVYPDGWVGKAVTVVPLEADCGTLDLRIVPAALKSSSLVANQTNMTITTSSGHVSSVSIGAIPVDVPFVVDAPPGRFWITIVFDSSMRPSSNGTSPDERELSAGLSAECRE